MRCATRAKGAIGFISLSPTRPLQNHPTSLPRPTDNVPAANVPPSPLPQNISRASKPHPVLLPRKARRKDTGPSCHTNRCHHRPPPVHQVRILCQYTGPCRWKIEGLAAKPDAPLKYPKCTQLFKQLGIGFNSGLEPSLVSNAPLRLPWMWAGSGGPVKLLLRGSVLKSIGVTVRRERRWTSAGATPARELVRSTRSNRNGSRGNEAVGAFDGKGRLADSASVQAIT